MTDGPGIAEALRLHWRPTFSDKGICRARLAAWLKEDAEAGNGLRADIRRAVDTAGSSAPGPDGIPASAWKQLGPLAVEVLFAAATALGQGTGLAIMLEASPEDDDLNTPLNEA